MHIPLALLHYPQINPTIFQIGPIKIRWYGVAYLTGFVAGYYLLLRLIRTNDLRIAVDDLGDLAGWVAMGVVVGGRAGWWIFYHKDMGVAEPWYEPFAINHGGMSFHGGLTGVIFVLLVWGRIKKVPFVNLADCLALVAPIGLFLGRIANFINGELVGRPSNVPWAMIFPGYTEPRHPSQIYEALLEGPLLMAIVWGVKRLKNRKDGQIAATFVIGYALIRFGVEFTREPDVQLGYIAWGWLTMGQLLSFAIGVVGVIWLIILHFRPPMPPPAQQKGGKGFPVIPADRHKNK
jgi:phosphatidylglycerol---prolipoprotein diacylglyceryl transferase